MNTLLLSIALSCAPGPDGKTACTGNHDHAAGAEADCHGGKAQAAAAAPAKGDALLLRGEKLKGLPTVTLDKLLASPADFEGKEVQVEAKVRKACEKKGCWMELAPTEKGPGVRVTFKDYGFFVPLDSAGSTAKVEGTVKVAELAPERAKHFEAEGAKVAKGKDGKYREVQLVALGLELRR
ncbi:MAG: DUF4920 domain-containing protein [Myxococcus sp.]|nr:DUF4920 domain-containing protein [Myxococcus sp.]